MDSTLNDFEDYSDDGILASLRQMFSACEVDYADGPTLVIKLTRRGGMDITEHEEDRAEKLLDFLFETDDYEEPL